MLVATGGLAPAVLRYTLRNAQGYPCRLWLAIIKDNIPCRSEATGEGVKGQQFTEVWLI